MLQRMVKHLLLVLKKKRKINYNQVRKKVVNWEGEENRNGYVQRKKKSEKDLEGCSVGDLH